ncbi:MAG: hypothetical protein LBP22_15760 [Deltaproteobacteria bacterium]|nr:hypothetical protein [Deltaproteobacteria bacterium]
MNDYNNYGDRNFGVLWSSGLFSNVSLWQAVIPMTADFPVFQVEWLIGS